MNEYLEKFRASQKKIEKTSESIGYLDALATIFQFFRDNPNASKQEGMKHLFDKYKREYK